MENAKKFFEEILKTEEAKALLESLQKPETEEEVLAAYQEIAKKLGIELTAEDIVAYFEAQVALEPESGELDDDELEQLVGGVGLACEETFLHHENCWMNDGCDLIFNSYFNYVCENLSHNSIALRLKRRVARKPFPTVRRLQDTGFYNA